MPAEPGTPAAAYISAAIPEASIEHFVLLMTESGRRPVLAAAIALARVIENIPRQSTEPEIGRLKLNWWLEEVEAIRRNAPRHPLSIELTAAPGGQAWLDPLLALVAGALNDIGRPPFSALADVLAYSHRGAERQALMAAVLPRCDEQALTQARNGGVGICLTELLRDRHAPGSRLVQGGLDGRTPADTTERLATLADEHFAQSRAMPAAQRRAQSSVGLQARLYRRLLARLRRYDFDPDRAVLRPAPLLWHAWREARNLRK